jgi:ataxia telangiectasia mutated family protein
LVKKICIDHPYHGLVQLIAMCNGNSSTSHNATNIQFGSGKVIAAEKLLRDIMKSAPVFVGELAESYSALINAYISLALADTTNLVQQKYTKNVPLSTLKIPGGSRNNILKCLKGRKKYLPCVMTRLPRISPLAEYGDGDEDPKGSERVVTFDSNFSITDSGIHRPKIIVCVGTKGGRYRQLVKGEGQLLVICYDSLLIHEI